MWDADVGGLIAALGVTSIVIGLALQNAVGGVISGLLLLFEQPFKIGDWLDAGRRAGTRDRGELAGRAHRHRLRHPDRPQLDAVGRIVHQPQPARGTAPRRDLGEVHDRRPAARGDRAAVEVADSLPMRVPTASARRPTTRRGHVHRDASRSPGRRTTQQALSLYLAWLWYAARRRGLALDGDSTDPIAEPGRLEEALDVVGPTLHLGDEDRGLVLASSRLERYGTGEIVLPTGIVPDEIRFIVNGHVGSPSKRGAAASSSPRRSPATTSGRPR